MQGQRFKTTVTMRRTAVGFEYNTRQSQAISETAVFSVQYGAAHQ
jgi:hypothetical protein